MTSQYFQGIDKMKPVQNTRAAYSDRTAWLMCEMSALAYLPFEGKSKLAEEIKIVAGIIKAACKAKKAEDIAAKISDIEVRLTKYIDQKTGDLTQREAEGTKLLTECLQVAGFSLVQTFDSGDTQAFLATREADKIVVLAFRGTEKNSCKDVRTDLNAKFYKGSGGIKVHSGFIGAFNYVKDDIVRATDDLDEYSLYITGHSLGGALAIIAAKELESDRLAACYTFGSPRVGGAEFGEKIKTPIYRIVNAADGVPRVPPSWFLSIIVGIISLVNGRAAEFLREKYCGYKHYGDMRYLTACDNDMNKLKVFENLGLVFRGTRLVKRILANGFLVIGKDHRIDEYRKKMKHYAMNRNPQ